MSTLSVTPAGLASRDSAKLRADGASGAAVHSIPLTTTWTILRFTFGLVPIVAGIDKFTNLLTNWENYLNPLVLQIIPVSGHLLMGAVGMVEIGAGILTLARPRIGGFIVSAWLICIAVSLIASGRYLDVAVRDLVMAIGAFTLANLTKSIIDTKAERSL